MRVALFFQLLLLVLWLGSGITIMLIGAPAAFAGSSDRASAGTVVGLMLHRWHLLALLIPTMLLVFEWRSGLQHTGRVLLLAGAIFLAIGQFAVDGRLRRMRDNTLTPISELAPADPYRRQFGMLHGVSSMLMLLQVAAAVAVLWTGTAPPPPPPTPSTTPTLEL